MGSGSNRKTNNNESIGNRYNFFCYHSNTPPRGSRGRLFSTSAHDNRESWSSTRATSRFGVTSSMQCHVEHCLFDYHKHVSNTTQTSKRCAMLQRLKDCMNRKAEHCRRTDRRFAFIDEKRQES